jgi:hypothetical protein
MFLLPSRSEVSVTPPLMTSPYGCQHSKLILAFYDHAQATASRGSPPGAGLPSHLRVLVSTSNHLPNELERKNQLHWVHDCLRRDLFRGAAAGWRRTVYGDSPGPSGGAGSMLRTPVSPPPGHADSPLAPLVQSCLLLAAQAAHAVQLIHHQHAASPAPAPASARRLLREFDRVFVQALCDALMLHLVRHTPRIPLPCPSLLPLTAHATSPSPGRPPPRTGVLPRHPQRAQRRRRRRPPRRPPLPAGHHGGK